MTAAYALSPKAQADLNDIWDYTAARWGIDQAELYVRQLGQSVAALAARSGKGRPCSEIREGYYRYPSGAHVLFYRRSEIGIEVVRILHGRMDFPQHL